ncbi:MAG: FAD:protein FMN transferase, partial [Ginsengibacter sp.]
LKDSMQLDLGGIAKGATAQRAYRHLRQKGFPCSLVDAGGDIVAGDVPEGIPGWTIAINLPRSENLMQKQLLLKNKSITTSGDLYQYLEVNGKRFSHIIDPRTGKALNNSRNVTVIADSGTDADWLTKACSILPIRKALRLVKKIPGAEVQIALLRHNRPVFYRSRGFRLYFKK